MNTGIHTKPIRGATNDWCTPKWVLDALGEFDLDPCSHPDQVHRTANTMIHAPADGLAYPWSDCRVFLNPPYGPEIKHWLARMAQHGNGVAFVPARTEVESWFWPYIWEAASAVLFLRGRLYFEKPNGTRLGNAGHGSVLAAYGQEEFYRLRDCGIPGRFVRLTI